MSLPAVGTLEKFGIKQPRHCWWCMVFKEAHFWCAKSLVSQWKELWKENACSFVCLLCICLNILFNIVEAPFQQLLSFDICVAWCSDGLVNNAKVLTFMRSLSRYYDWISPLKKQADLPFSLTQQSMGREEYGKSSHVYVSTSLEHLLVFWGVIFSGFIFTLIAYGHAPQIFFLCVKTFEYVLIDILDWSTADHLNNTK